MRYSGKTLITVAGILFFVALGLLSIAYGVRTITTTQTTVITLPGTVYTTVLEIEEGEAEVTVRYPSYVAIMVEEREDQICIIKVTPLEVVTQQVIEIPGTTIEFPGATFVFSTVLDQPTYATTIIDTIEGYATTTTGLNFGDYVFQTVVSMPGFTTTFEFTIPVYAETITECSSVVVSYENTFIIIEDVPARCLLPASFQGLHSQDLL